MLKNYIKIAVRNLIRNKSSAFINIFGLAVALAVFVVIIFYMRHETSYDEHLPEFENVYRVLLSNDEGAITVEGTPPPLPGQLKDLFPEVKYGAKVRPLSNSATLFEYVDKQIYQENMIFAESDFFQIFQYKFVHGTRTNSLTEPNSIVITEDLSEKLFGDLNPVGESIALNVMNRDLSYTVMGVVENPPSNTHLNFSAVAFLPEANSNNWNWNNGISYIRIADNNVHDLQNKFPGYIENHVNFGEGTSSENRRLILQPVNDVYFYPLGRESGSNKTVYIWIFFTVAFLILLVACVNYVNLSIAQSLERVREIGIRKTMGASRWQVIQQVMVETFITCAFAFALGLMFVELSQPIIQRFFDIGLMGMDWFNPEGILFLFGLLGTVTLLIGTYCAFYLSSFMPNQVLKSGVESSVFSPGTLRKGLIVGQFAISIIIIIATVMVTQQMNYIQGTRLNGHDSRIVVLNNRSTVIAGQFNAFRQELLQHTSITNAAAGDMLGEFSFSMMLDDSSGTTGRIQWVEGTHEYLETLGLELVSGRYLNAEIASDSTDTVLINEAAAQRFGIEEANGQYIPSPVKANVVGVFKNYHPRSFYEKISPTIVRFSDDALQMSNIFVNLQETQITEGLEQIRETWSSFQPGYPVDYTFLDRELDKQYKSELQMARIFSGFAGFSIFIACLGLFGLATFSARRRTKEIGIRKVLGATVSNIIRLLAKDFVLLVLLAFVLSIPVAWYGIHQWLQNFAYRIEISPLIFLAIGGVVLSLALATVSWQSIKAALMNPVESLRSE